MESVREGKFEFNFKNNFKTGKQDMRWQNVDTIPALEHGIKMKNFEVSSVDDTRLSF